MTVPTLRTDRLILRGLRLSDLEDIARYAGDYEVSKWLVPVPHPYTLAHARDFLRMDRAGEIGSLWMITADNAVIGAVSTGADLGYWLAPNAWGQGYMTEAATAAVNSHFEISTDDLIRSSHFVENHASRRVLEKLGFIDTGAHTHFSKARQADVPGRSMELTRTRWESLRNG